ncbi:Rho GTPase activation protein [Hypoxylon fuscum]|nr:Rho GTPase activation protein [Hypoxylon fuscum]
MTSAITPSKPQQQTHQMSPPQQPPPAAHPASPPSKRDLKSWWKSFQTRAKHQETQEQPKGIFGVPLRQSITYANVAISLVDEKGKSYIYGYVPIVVAKCGVFLKEKATGVEGIFRLSGSEKRIKELKLQFDSPDRYGKGLVWDGYTVHDAANVLRRYLNDLPEPVVPLDLYERFRDPLRGHTKQAVGDTEGTQLVENFDEVEAIAKYQQLIKDLPPLNRQLLLYILDLLAVFAAKAEENRMTAQNLAAIFQPGMLSHPQHAMAPEEYRLNQCVIIFLIENQDHFLIGTPDPRDARDPKPQEQWRCAICF